MMAPQVGAKFWQPVLFGTPDAPAAPAPRGTLLRESTPS